MWEFSSNDIVHWHLGVDCNKGGAELIMSHSLRVQMLVVSMSVVWITHSIRLFTDKYLMLWMTIMISDWSRNIS